MAHYLKEEKQKHHDKMLVGFQWKTFKEKYVETRTREFAKAWHYLGKHKVHAIYYTRNPLDEFLSAAKHSAHKNLPPHCVPDDDECLKKMAQPFRVNATAWPEFLREYFVEQKAIARDM